MVVLNPIIASLHDRERLIPIECVIPMKTCICIGQIAVYKFSEVSCALKRVNIESLVEFIFSC